MCVIYIITERYDYVIFEDLAEFDKNMIKKNEKDTILTSQILGILRD